MLFTKHARTDLKKLDRSIQRAVLKKMKEMRSWPQERLFDKILRGFHPVLYAVRSGDYRIVFYRLSTKLKLLE